MFESLVERLLETYLSDWITDYNQLHLSVWSGDLKLRNLKIKPDLFEGFRFPFVVQDGRIGEIQIKVC